jgi:hypothetical protein
MNFNIKSTVQKKFEFIFLIQRILTSPLPLMSSSDTVPQPLFINFFIKTNTWISYTVAFQRVHISVLVGELMESA